MAAIPKLTPEQWAQVRKTWEADSREGFTWLVDELALPVSPPGVRKTAVKGGWLKSKAASSIVKEATPKVSKVSEKNHRKVSEVAPETIKDTLPETIRVAERANPVPAALQKPERYSGLQLTVVERLFVEEYMIDQNASAAYKRACPDVTDASAGTLGSRLLQKVEVVSAIAIAREELSNRTNINAERALREVWAIVTADPRELVQVKVGCCRFCYGENHKRQRTVAEMNADKEEHVTKGKDLATFDEEGGIGYDMLKTPHASCSTCGGDGESRAVLMDSRNFSPQAAALYAGAKQGKYGIEIQMHSKTDAMDKLFRHLGLYEADKDPVGLVFVGAEKLDEIYREKMAEKQRRAALIRGRLERLGDSDISDVVL